jgi:hypothetical protein
MFGTVCEAVLKLETAPEGDATLRDIGLVIGRVLHLLEVDQAILEAADHLYEAAFALQEIRDKGPGLLA